MKKLKKLSNTKLTNSELLQMAWFYFEILTRYFKGDAFAQMMSRLLNQNHQILKTAVAKTKINAAVEKVAELDGLRGDAFILFKNLIAAYEWSKKKEEKEAYLTLWAVIERLGTRLYTGGYVEQSGKLAMLINEMNKPERLAAMDLLGVRQKFEALEETEKQFAEAYKERLQIEANQEESTLKQSKREMISLLVEVHAAFNLYVRGMTADDNPEWVRLLNEQIEQMRSVIAARKTRKKNKATVADQEL